MEAILFTPQEYRFLCNIYVIEAPLQNIQPGKANYDQQLFILLFFNNHNCTFGNLEFTFNLSSSSCGEILPRAARALLNGIKNYFGNLFPNRATRDAWKTLLLESLRLLGIFFLLILQKC